MKKPLVYIAHPIGKDPLGGARRAFEFANSIIAFAVPIVPNNPAWQLAFPKTYEEWMAYDFDLVAGCQALFRMPGDSPGADREVALAEHLGLPVFTALPELRQWAQSRKPAP